MLLYFKNEFKRSLTFLLINTNSSIPELILTVSKKYNFKNLWFYDHNYLYYVIISKYNKINIQITILDLFFLVITLLVCLALKAILKSKSTCVLCSESFYCL